MSGTYNSIDDLRRAPGQLLPANIREIRDWLRSSAGQGDAQDNISSLSAAMVAWKQGAGGSEPNPQ